jgi:hypothetical protein
MTADRLTIRCKEIARKIEAIESGVSNLYPIADGIININNYVNSKYKILWILKESNENYDARLGSPQKRIGKWHLNEAINDLKTWQQQPKTGRTVFKRIMLTSYIIQKELNDSVSDILKEIDLNNPDLLISLKSIALINIKKIPGNTYANPDEIAEAYKKNKHILKEQIEVYNPDIVICGNTLQYFSVDNYFAKENRKPLEHGKHHYYPLKDRIYLQTYHPAYKHSNSEFEIKYIDKIVKAVNNWKNNYWKV